MQFLYGPSLTATVRKLCGKQTETKIAIAYWGHEAIKLMNVNPKKQNIKVICCLKGGKSDPEVIKRFGNRARQNDRLHAKVMWTPDAAIVGSANASSNGLPEEEGSAVGLIEAGIYIEDTSVLRSIRQWFDNQYGNAKKVTLADLKAAKVERDRRIWNSKGAPKAQKRSLLKALQEGGKLEFGGQRIAFILWKRPTTLKENAGAKKLLRQKTTDFETVFKLPSEEFDRLSWYTEWTDIPLNTFLISCRFEGARIADIDVQKTFDIKKNWRINVEGESETVTYVIKSGFKGFNYELSAGDNRTIRSSAKELWKKAKGDQDGRVLHIIDAAPILLKNRRK
jgi:hypothetical protein